MTSQHQPDPHDQPDTGPEVWQSSEDWLSYITSPQAFDDAWDAHMAQVEGEAEILEGLEVELEGPEL